MASTAARGLKTFDRQSVVIHQVAGPILDRHRGDTRMDSKGDAPRHVLGAIREAVFEIGIHGQGRDSHQRPQMVENGIETKLSILLTRRPCRTGTGRGDRPESSIGQPQCAAGIPGIGQNEEAAVVHPPEGDALLCHRGGARHA